MPLLVLSNLVIHIFTTEKKNNAQQQSVAHQFYLGFSKLYLIVNCDTRIKSKKTVINLDGMRNINCIPFFVSAIISHNS